MGGGRGCVHLQQGGPLSLFMIGEQAQGERLGLEHYRVCVVEFLTELLAEVVQVLLPHDCSTRGTR